MWDAIRTNKLVSKTKQPEPRVSITTSHPEVKVIKKLIKAFKQTIEMKQPEPRVSVTTPHISVLRMQKSEHTEPRVSVPEKASPKDILRLVGIIHQKPTPPIQSPPIATRTRAAQASAKLKTSTLEVAT